MINEWANAKLEDVLGYIQPTNYIVSSTEYSDEYKTPVLTAGKSFIIGYTNEENGIFDRLPTIIFDDFTTAIQFVNFKFKVKSSAMKILVPTSSSVDIRYVFYLMKTLRVNTDTHKRFWISIFSQLPVKIASSPEQKVMADQIEELFSDLDNAIENLKKAKGQLKVYRQAVLKHAFEGKLTNETVKEGELPKDWKLYSIKEVVKTIDGDRGRNYPKKNEFYDKGHCLFLSTKNVREDRFVFNENIFISKEKDEILRGGKLQLNDVVITTRGTLGNVALYDEKVPFENVRINSGMLILRVTNPILNNYFLMKFISSPLFGQQLKKKQSGTAQPQIPANVLREIQMPIPSTLDAQEKVVAEIERRLSVCDQLEETIVNGLNQAESLRQSILKQAFEGRLTEQWRKEHKDLISGENSAEVLLKKIKAEKESLHVKPKGKKKHD